MKRVTFTKVFASRLLLLCILTSLVCACSLLKENRFNKVSKGMTKSQVVRILGEPDEKSFDQTEIWGYYNTSYYRGDYVLVLEFYRDRVVSMHRENLNPDTYRTPSSRPRVGFDLGFGNANGGIRIGVSDFAVFFRNFQRDNSPRSRLAAIRSYSRDHRISPRECASLMNVYTFDDKKLEVLRSVAPALERTDLFPIFDALTFSSSKDKAKEILQIPPAKSVCLSDAMPLMFSKIMSQNDFNRFLSSVKDEAFKDDKLKMMETVANRGVLIRSQQLGTLIKLFTFDDDKLDVAKIFPGRIADRENLVHVLKLFTFDDAKDKFMRLYGLRTDDRW